ncbi:hypothetical protein PGTUg99_013477 [Puccinia graminis f. sp. tritici]|uniref:Uncharacterized protein n=1 Tax=Puccinia graminis f. sp. tritici TaxID=56615 RepID=A0A5B0N0C9_PUCGR|nr:hypothetical protein PGTUg99_013477 [Puccinia graminis f. sp. tritici]
MALRLPPESLSQSGRYFLQGPRDLPLANSSDDASLHSEGAMKRQAPVGLGRFLSPASPLPAGERDLSPGPPTSSSTSFLSELLSPTCPPRGSSQTSPNPRIAGWMPMIAD